MKYKYHKKTYGILAILVVLFICATSCNRETNNNAAPGSDKGGSGGSNYWNSSEICKENPQAATAGTNISVTYSGFDEDTSVTNEACQIKFDGNNADISGAGAEIIKGECVTVKITEAGTYVISGSTDNGQLYVEAGENQVHLVLNGATINCKKSAPIYINNGKKTVITLASNTVNTLTDEDSYEYSVTEVDETTGETTGEPNAALFSKKALTINGEGTLNVTANFNNGIGCKDELKIISGKINVAAVNNAIRGNDCVVIKAGTVKAESTSGDGIKSTKEDNAEKGYVYIEGGVVNVTAREDALQAVTLLAVTGGEVSLSAGDDGMHCDNKLAIGLLAKSATRSDEYGPLKMAIYLEFNTTDTVIPAGTYHFAEGNEANTFTVGTVDIVAQTFAGSNLAYYLASDLESRCHIWRILSGTVEVSENGSFVAAGKLDNAKNFKITCTLADTAVVDVIFDQKHIEKLMREGKIVISIDGVEYDMQGRMIK